MHTLKDTFLIGGDLPVRRLGFGAMRLTGPGIWGPPDDEPNARHVLRRAVELGVQFIDTADVYGPGCNEELICDALGPYPPGLVVATKGGLIRSGPATRENPGMTMNGSEAHIRTAIEGSLRRLKVERIELYQLHRVDPLRPIEETMLVLGALQAEGKIRHIGLSEVTVNQVERARTVVDIATVQNVYSLSERRHEEVLTYCEQNGIAFIPFWPLHGGELVQSLQLTNIAKAKNATVAQVVLAWLFCKSPNIMLIPGTSSTAHLEENLESSKIHFSLEEMAEIEASHKLR